MKNKSFIASSEKQETVMTVDKRLTFKQDGIFSPTSILSKDSVSGESSDQDVFLDKPTVIKEEKIVLSPKKLKKKIMSQLDSIIEGYDRQNPLATSKSTKDAYTSRQNRRIKERSIQQPDSLSCNFKKRYE